MTERGVGRGGRRDGCGGGKKDNSGGEDYSASAKEADGSSGGDRYESLSPPPQPPQASSDGGLASNAVAATAAGAVSVVVDLGFPWPKEAGPAKERKTAVVKQLTNFVRDVLKSHTAAASASSSSPSHSSTSSSTASIHFQRMSPCFPPVRCCGVGAADVAARLAPLSPWVTVRGEDFFGCFSANNTASNKPSGDESSTSNQPPPSPKSVILYLSPEAEAVLDTRWGFPRNSANGSGRDDGGGQSVILVVGGLVDRKVKRGRSRARAAAIAAQGRRTEEAPAEPTDGNYGGGFAGGGHAAKKCSGGGGEQVVAVQLPLGDDCGAPLNIDTVLIMLFYWYHFSDEKAVGQGVLSGSMLPPPQPPGVPPPSSLLPLSPWALPIEVLGGGAKEAPVGEAFAAARHRAMAEHKLRHPNQGRHIL